MQNSFTLLFLLAAFVIQAQPINTEFGKNRVQFHKEFDEWSHYESDNFETYWYGEGRNIGQAAVQIAEQEFADIQNILEHRINDRIHIIVYKDLTDLKQSNLGSEDAFENSTGQTKIVGNKMFIYFNGDHLHLRRQIREGIASVFLNAMLFGSNLQEIVQNAVMMNLPEWFKQGLIAYCGEAWNTDLDNQLRDVILREEFRDFEKFAEANPKLAGHSMWYYISQNYSKTTVSNLLYLTRINRSIESGFLYVLGLPYERVTDSWAIFFRQRYEQEVKEFDEPAGTPVVFKNKKRLPISQVKISPDSKKIVYVANEIGKYKVYLQDVATGKREVIHKGGFRNNIQATDYEYPLLCWTPGNNQIGIVFEKRDVPKLMLYDLNTGEKLIEPLDPQYQRVHSIDFLDNNVMVFSATVKGFSDLFFYYTNTRQTQRITQDIWDDLDASVVQLNNQRGIIFVSNRPDSTLLPVKLDTLLPTQNFDIFYYNIDKKENELVRITNTPLNNERHPVAMDTTWFAFLSDESGIYNRMTGYLEDYVAWHNRVIQMKDGQEIILHADSTLTGLDSTAIDTSYLIPVIKQRAVNQFQTNYDRNIIEIHTAPRAGQKAELVFKNGKSQILASSIAPEEKFAPKPTRFFVNQLESRRQKNNTRKNEPAPKPESGDNILKENKEPATEIKDLPVEKMDTGMIDIDNYFFQSPFDEQEMPSRTRQEEEAPEETVVLLRPENVQPLKTNQDIFRFRSSRISPYKLRFKTDFVTTQLDNNLLFEGLNSFAGTPDQFSLPPPGILFKANFKDLLEDYVIEGGIRIPTTFNGAEYFLYLDDKKNRLDKRYALYRKGTRYVEDQTSIVPRRSESVTIIGLTRFKYPLDLYRSIRATATFRMDRLTQLSTDASTLPVPNYREQRLGLKLEYVFDNTIDVAINIKNGTRYKFFAEAMKRFEIDLGDDFKFEARQGWMGVIGIDARHYQRFLKYSVFAARFAGATSFGDEKILYYLGAVENWIFPKFDETIPVPSNTDFASQIAFQTLAANVRGFKMNIRNGNSFALINTEVRIPIFRYLFPRSRSGFFRNFQAVGFFDAGTAWQGVSPFSRENPLNTIYLPDGGIPGKEPVVLKVNYFRDPIVAGYGIGARVLVFGYLVRFDYGWGVETRKVQKPLMHISFGTDF